MPCDTLQYHLSDQQVQHMQEEGYLVIERLFDDAELQPVIDEISADLDQRCRKAVAEGKLSRTYEEFDFEHRLTCVDAENQTISKSMWDNKVALPSFFGLMTNPKLLDVAEQLCGPELIASSVYRLRPKVPSHSWSPVPWHQDSGYFEPYCDLGLILTVWLPLVDATEERGCLWVMPRMHKGGLFFHQPDAMAHYLVIPDEEFGGRQPVPAPVPKGGVLLLTNRTPHASFENKTDVVRWSMDLRYQSATLPTNAPITRLPGEAKSAGTVGVPVACNPPEPDFLVRSQIRPHEVMKTAEEFIALRKNHVYQAATDRWGYSVAKRKDPLGNPYKTGGPTGSS
ncbi:MAG TPA: phytanoyl-CoA dioxygenase family protein [Terriglobia bacterium]|nr:phytanoyl-CoA dioxygenase family protein [Terriglobia bacterium]